MNITLSEIESALDIIRPHIHQTPCYAWPLLQNLVGAKLYVKHENHTLTGSFKARGGIYYLHQLKQSNRKIRGIVTATRGNHGQSIAYASTAMGLKCKIIVPEGNSEEKNAAMAAFGGEVIIHGQDFDISRKYAAQLERDEGYHFVPSLHEDLVRGVSTYALELFSQASNLDIVYVPIGMGSGICSLIKMRDLLGLHTEIIGVVSEKANAFALSFKQGEIISTSSAATFADGMACREPQPAAFEIVKNGALDIIEVSEAQIAKAVRLYHKATHNMAEGAGAASLAAALKDKNRNEGKNIAVIHTGGNIDLTLYQDVLQGKL